MIILNKKEKQTSLRISIKTKKMLESLAIGKETHEQILLRLIKMTNIASAKEGSQLIPGKAITGAKYKRDNRTIDIDTGKAKYSVVCTFNNLDVIIMLRENKQLASYITEKPEWELDLEIVNIKKDVWEKPSLLERRDKREFLLLYLVCLKQILEDIFDIDIFEISKEDDYFDIGLWQKGYIRNNFSMESFQSDIEKKIGNA